MSGLPHLSTWVLQSGRFSFGKPPQLARCILRYKSKTVSLQDFVLEKRCISYVQPGIWGLCDVLRAYGVWGGRTPLSSHGPSLPTVPGGWAWGKVLWGSQAALSRRRAVILVSAGIWERIWLRLLEILSFLLPGERHFQRSRENSACHEWDSEITSSLRWSVILQKGYNWGLCQTYCFSLAKLSISYKNVQSLFLFYYPVYILVT